MDGWIRKEMMMMGSEYSGSRWCPLLGFGVSVVGPSDSAATELHQSIGTRALGNLKIATESREVVERVPISGV
jgi:hypothetical protein